MSSSTSASRQSVQTARQLVEAHPIRPPKTAMPLLSVSFAPTFDSNTELSTYKWPPFRITSAPPTACGAEQRGRGQYVCARQTGFFISRRHLGAIRFET